MALLGGGAPAIEHPRPEWQAEWAGRVPPDDRRLVEAALDVAGLVQGHGQHEIGQGQVVPAPLLRHEQAEQPPEGRFTVELECAYAVVDGGVVKERCHQEVPGPIGQGRRPRQFRLTGRAQVERVPGTVQAAPQATEKTGGGQAERSGCPGAAINRRPQVPP